MLIVKFNYDKTILTNTDGEKGKKLGKAILLTNADVEEENTSDCEIIDFPYLIQKYSSELSEEKRNYITKWFSDNDLPDTTKS
jgi:hypothetical protein